MENIAAEDTAIEMIARHVEGGLRDAIGLLEQMTIDGKILAENVRSHLGVTGFQTVETLTNLLEKHELQKAIHLINEVHNEGYDLTAFVRELLEHMREKMITGITQNNEIQQGLLVMIEAFEEARNMLRNTVIPQLPLEIAAIKICGSDSPMGSVAITENKEKPVATKIATKTEANEIKLEQNIEKDKAAVKEETEAAQEIKKQLETEAYKDGNIKQHWPRVLEHVNPASLRRSVSCSTVSEIDENTIKLTFNSRFHMEKAVKIEHKAAIEKAIEHLMGKKIKIVCEYSGPMEGEAVASIQDRDTAEKARSGKKVEKSAPAEPQKKADLADTVMGMFEGDGNSGW
jgi:DNA polymerase-3 subunit gamma/tau